MSRLNIAYIVPSLSNRGPIKVVYELVNQLKQGHTIEIFYFDENKELDFDVPVHHISFFSAINFDKFDIIHSHGIRPDAYLFFHHHKIKKAKSVTTLHNYVKMDLRYQYNLLISFIFSRVWNIFTSRHERIIVLSEDAKRYYLKFWRNKAIDVVYNGISEHVKRTPLEPSIKDQLAKLKKEFILIGAIGLLTKRKGFDQIIKALPALPRHTLIIVGDGKEAEALQGLSHSLGVSDRVVFLGFQSNIPAILDELDMVVIPSRSEGFSLVIQEAARQYKPVVCSSIPIFHELFSPNEVQFFDLEHIDSLRMAIENISDNADAFADNLYRKFLSDYTSKTMASRYLDIYRKLLK
ncbi:MAG: glycosyltransferase family 4 protein [Sulfurovum sp.]|nr:glycosyltransferase family 4 protein [Sulfurovum sp.]